MTKEEVLYILKDEELANMWYSNKPKVFYKNKKPHSLLFETEHKDGILINSTSLNGEHFPISLMRHCLRLAKNNILYIAHNKNQIEVSKTIVKSLKKYTCWTIRSSKYLLTRISNG